MCIFWWGITNLGSDKHVVFGNGIASAEYAHSYHDSQKYILQDISSVIFKYLCKKNSRELFMVVNSK